MKPNEIAREWKRLRVRADCSPAYPDSGQARWMVENELTKFVFEHEDEIVRALERIGGVA